MYRDRIVGNHDHLTFDRAAIELDKHLTMTPLNHRIPHYMFLGNQDPCLGSFRTIES